MMKTKIPPFILLSAVFLGLYFGATVPLSAPPRPQVYAANSVQLGTLDPSLQILQNDAGLELTITRLQPGWYRIDAPADTHPFAEPVGLSISNNGQIVDVGPKKNMALGWWGDNSLLLTVTDLEGNYTDVWAAHWSITLYP